MPSKISKKQLEKMMGTALKASLAAGEISKSYFHRRIKIKKKTDNSPVTIADQETEKEFRRQIQKAYPEHQIIGEEFGLEKNKDSEFEWFIDPIDGTLQFIRGLPLWGSVLGLRYQNKPILGVIHHPAIKLSVWASKGSGCFANAKKVRCADTKSLKNSTVLYSGLRRTTKKTKASLFRVLDEVYDDRGFGDCYAHCLVMQGFADAMIDLKVAPHDISGVQICVEEAGGHFSALNGKKSIFEGTALSCVKPIAKPILAAFKA